jgi:MFS family permease
MPLLSITHAPLIDIFISYIAHKTDDVLGVVLTCSASATDFPRLAVCRFFLGVFEACINPGFIMITSSWWKTGEQARRIGLWYSAVGFVNIVVVLLFYAVAHVHVRFPLLLKPGLQKDN